MIKKTVNLRNVKAVKDFVQIMSRCPKSGELVSGKYVVDAKSILGVFSLDLSKAITLRINGEETDVADTLDELKPFFDKE